MTQQVFALAPASGVKSTDVAYDGFGDVRVVRALEAVTA